MIKNTNLFAAILLSILALIWGSSFILIKRGLVVFNAGEVGALRIVAASVFMLPVAINGLRTVEKKYWKYLLAVGFFGSLLPSFLFATAQTEIPSSVAGILNALTPLFTMIIGASFFSQRFTTQTVIGLIMGFLGSAILIAAGSGGDLSSINYYALLVVLATIFYGANLNIIKFKMPELKAKLITSLSLALVGPIAIVYLFLGTEFLVKLNTAEGALFSFGAVVLLGVLGTAIALILFNHLVKITSPIYTSSVTYIIPLVALAWGLWDGEKLFLGHYIGMAAIILGVYLSNRKKG